ncbi:MAG: hypothetical protein HZC36_14830 [Armatimonadetes bacterium]|nr:hypothetical protein [Armatimonadota bacterium]
MSRLKWLLATVSLACLAAAGFQGASTPERSLNEFAAAFVAGDFAKAVTYVVGGKLDPQMSMMANAIKQQGPTLKLSKMAVKRNGDKATVNVTVTMGSRQGGSHTEVEDVPMKLVGGKWLIVPASGADPGAGRKPIQGMAQMLSQGMRPLFQEAKSRAMSTTALSNVKQLAVATIMYSSDYDDKYPPTVGGWHKAIFPYCKNERLFKAPGDKGQGDSFALNAYVAGKSYSRMAMPSDVVMVYQGKGQKLAFDQTGRAAVAFCDGHARLVDREAAKKLRWKP